MSGGFDYGITEMMSSFGPTKAAGHTNPYYTYMQTFTPRKLKDLFRWCEFLYYHSSHIYAALRKFGEYPITDVLYSTTNKALEKRYKYLMENVLRVRELMIKATLDKYVYGNSFNSMYQPFVRYLKCPKCKTLSNIQYISYTFNLKKFTFTYDCPACKRKVTASDKHLQDRKLMLGKKIHFIRWDPKYIDIDYNPINGTSTYYYDIPQEVVHAVRKGHKHLIDTMPVGFLEAIRDNKQFKFADEAIFHMKVGGPAGVQAQWGIPPLVPALPMFHYAQILRRANEAIALDHLVPMRVMHPLPASSTADPFSMVNLSNWKSEMQKNLSQYRQDPLHIMFAPVPVGVTQIGGQGRALMTLGEVQEAEKNIVASMGIPMEFLYGGLTRSGMEATLRLIENQLQTHTNDLRDLLQWIADKSGRFLGWERIRTDLKPFRMIDDTYHQQAVMSIYAQGMQTGKPLVSDQTIREMHQLDPDKEDQRIKQETLTSVRQQQDLQQEMQELQSNAAMQAQMQAAGGGQGSYNPQEVMMQADSIVQQLMQMDEGSKKSALHQLQVEDYVMYSVVIQRMEMVRQGGGMQAGGVM